MEISDVQYAKSGDVNLAYQRWGAGPDLVVVPPLVSNVELGWEQEIYRRAREHVGRHVRILEFDKRGIGLSDRFTRSPTLGERIADITAVMDAEGIERASLLGMSEGGIMSQLFAATHPERVDRVILANSTFGLSAISELSAYAGDEAIDPEAELADRLVQLERVAETWGRDPIPFVELNCPSQRDNASFVRWAARFQRQAASPADFRRQLDSVVDLDANDRLHEIGAPTLVTNVTDDRLVHPAVGRFLADKIPGARYEEFPGQDHYCWVLPNWRELLDCWVTFLTGTAPAPRDVRRFATVLFTDIVDSTSEAARVGDAAWRTTMEEHDRLAWRAVDVHQGALIKNTGDGLLVTFDVPSNALACVAALRRELETLGLTIRAGLHAGEVEVRDDGDVAGIAVNIAARVEQAAREGTTYVSSTVRDMLLGGQHAFEDRGEHDLKGIDGLWRLYELAR